MHVLCQMPLKMHADVHVHVNMRLNRYVLEPGSMYTSGQPFLEPGQARAPAAQMAHGLRGMLSEMNWDIS